MDTMHTNHSELIEKYIDGDLKDDEKLAFEQLIESNEEVARDYEVSLDVDRALMRRDTMELRKKLMKIYQSDSNSQ